MALQPNQAIVNDSNAELVNCYQTVRDESKKSIVALSQHRNTAEYYYEIRDWDRSPDYCKKSAVERARELFILTKHAIMAYFV